MNKRDLLAAMSPPDPAVVFHKMREAVQSLDSRERSLMRVWLNDYHSAGFAAHELGVDLAEVYRIASGLRRKLAAGVKESGG
jgi:hypothetical protein